MRKRIVGVTVGTPISPKVLEKILKPVKTINGVEPDENGGVKITVPVPEDGADGRSIYPCHYTGTINDTGTIYEYARYNHDFFRYGEPNDNDLFVTITGHVCLLKRKSVYVGGSSGTYTTYSYERIADINGPQGEQGIQGAKGDTGESGYSPVIGKDYWTETDKDAIVTQASNLAASALQNSSDIICDATGSSIVVGDAAQRELNGLTLYGKTIQNGTPTPEAPVPLESVGDDGNVAVTVCGKNLLPMPPGTYENNGVTYQIYEDGRIVANGTAEGISTLDIPISLQPGVKYTLSGSPSGGSLDTYCLYMINTSFKQAVHDYGDGTNFVPEYSNYDVRPRIADGYTANKLTFYPMVRLASVADATYEPYKDGGSVTAHTPNGLPGIPVSSGGNYTDENGQQWICDEIDFARGKYVKRIGTKTFKGTEAFTQISSNLNCWRVVVPEMWTETAGGSDFNTVLALSCSHFKPVLYKRASQAEDGTVTFYSTGEHIIRFTHNSKAVPEYMAEQYDSGNPVKVLYKLAVSVETDLTAEEIAQYSALHTNYPNTTIYNDEGAGMSIKYVADTKMYIDNKFAELATAILNA